MSPNRRRIVGKFVLGLSLLWASIGGFYALWSALSQPAWWGVIPPGLKVASVLLGILVLVLDVTWLVLTLQEIVRGEGSQYLLSRSEEGTARISLRAIQSSLLRRARELEEVIGAKLTVRRPGDKRLRIEVAYTTTEDRNAIQISEALRRALRLRFGELVHLEDDFEVDYEVKIDGFVPGSAPPRQRTEKEDREPFIGPRYPID